MKQLSLAVSEFLAIATLFAVPVRAQKEDPSLNRDARLNFHVRRAATSTYTAGYTPGQIRRAYGFDQITNDGTGQMIAIVDAYGSPSIQRDLNTFCAQFGIPSTTVKIYYPSGKPTKTDGGWALETSLDVEWAHAVAPAATIVLVVSKDASLGNLLSAVDYAVKLGAKQISMSWGAGEFSTERNYDSHFNKSGITFTASSGDSGAGVLWPAVSPYVVGVGGTSLSLDSSGNVISETAWNGSGGGTSTIEPEPSYQSAFQTSGKRMVPDVSYDADPNTGFPVYDSTSYSGSAGWFEVGGTSAGAPQWAALVALVNGSRASSLSNTDTPLYQIGAPATRSSYYRDVTSGSNGGYNAGTGYDEVTGLGSPLSNNMVPSLIAY